MKSLLFAFLTCILLAVILSFAPGCANHSARLADLAGSGAHKISVQAGSNFNAISVDMMGGEIVEYEDGSKTIEFNQVIYNQANPFWHTKILLEGYKRVLPSE